MKEKISPRDQFSQSQEQHEKKKEFSSYPTKADSCTEGPASRNELICGESTVLQLSRLIESPNLRRIRTESLLTRNANDSGRIPRNLSSHEDQQRKNVGHHKSSQHKSTERINLYNPTCTSRKHYQTPFTSYGTAV